MIRALAPLLLLSACSVTIDLPGQCDAKTVQGWLGQKYSYRLERRIGDKTHSISVRVIRPDTVVTMDVRDNRANIVLDEKDIVTRLYCG